MNRERGYALIMTLGFAVILTMMATILLVRNKATSDNQGQYTTNVRLDSVADAAVNHALVYLQNDPDWIAGFQRQTLPNTGGEYTITFNPNPDTRTNAVGESTNNLSGTGLANGPRGDNTVVPGTAELVVQVQERGLSKSYKVVVKGQANTADQLPISTDGRIRLRGDVEISGIKSVIDPEPVEAMIHSNYLGTEVPIEWSGAPGEEAVITGTVGASSSVDPDMGAAQLLGSPPVETNTPRRQLGSIDILDTIQNKRGAAPANLGSFGTQTLGDGSGQEFYVNGDLNIDGDLILNGAELYVEGKLTVNGTVEGSGGVYVAGDPQQPDQPATEFFGSANISAGDGKLALFSKGSVVLKGFDGKNYLEQLGQSDPTAQAALDEMQLALNANDQLLQNENILTIQDRSTPAGIRRLEILRSLGDFPNGNSVGGFNRAPLVLADLVDANGAGPAERFMSKRLRDTSSFFNGGGTHYGGDQIVLAAFNPDDPSTYRGMYDSVIDQYNNAQLPGYNWDQLWGRVRTYSNNISWDRIGSASFKGEIYTNGYFYSENDVSILGSVQVHDDGSQAPSTQGGEAISPGDLFLRSGSNIVFVQEDEQGQSTTGLGTLHPAVWY